MCNVEWFQPHPLLPCLDWSLPMLKSLFPGSMRVYSEIGRGWNSHWLNMVTLCLFGTKKSPTSSRGGSLKLLFIEASVVSVQRRGTCVKPGAGRRISVCERVRACVCVSGLHFSPTEHRRAPIGGTQRSVRKDAQNMGGTSGSVFMKKNKTPDLWHFCSQLMSNKTSQNVGRGVMEAYLWNNKVIINEIVGFNTGSVWNREFMPIL